MDEKTAESYHASHKGNDKAISILQSVINVIRTHLAYIANAKKSCYIKQQFTVLKARAS